VDGFYGTNGDKARARAVVDQFAEMVKGAASIATQNLVLQAMAAAGVKLTGETLAAKSRAQGRAQAAGRAAGVHWRGRAARPRRSPGKQRRYHNECEQRIAENDEAFRHSLSTFVVIFSQTRPTDTLLRRSSFPAQGLTMSCHLRLGRLLFLRLRRHERLHLPRFGAIEGDTLFDGLIAQLLILSIADTSYRLDGFKSCRLHYLQPPAANR
jgi:hypothetical protein